MWCLQSTAPRHLQSVDPTFITKDYGGVSVVEGVLGPGAKVRNEEVLSFLFKLLSTCLKHCMSSLLILLQLLLQLLFLACQELPTWLPRFSMSAKNQSSRLGGSEAFRIRHLKGNTDSGCGFLTF